MKLDSKYFDRIRTRRKREPEPEKASPTCQWDGCEKPGVHRAPVGRNAEGQFFLFCFEHVKEYNKGYNYFSGLSDTEIARYQKEAITGHRPTWTMGVKRGRAGFREEGLDPDGFFRDFGGARRAPEPARASLPAAAMKAFHALGFDEPPQEKGAVKARFKELVRRLHPDTNGGDRSREDKLREVIQAYNHLKAAKLA